MTSRRVQTRLIHCGLRPFSSVQRNLLCLCMLSQRCLLKKFTTLFDRSSTRHFMPSCTHHSPSTVQHHRPADNVCSNGLCGDLSHELSHPRQACADGSLMTSLANNGQAKKPKRKPVRLQHVHYQKRACRNPTFIPVFVLKRFIYS